MRLLKKSAPACKQVKKVTQKALVLHSGLQHAEHVAIGFKMAGELDRFATAGLVPFDEKVAERMRLVPSFHRMYLNRSTRLLTREEIISVSRYEAVERFAQKFTRDYERKRAITHWRDRAMSRYMARRLPDELGKLYSFPNVALDAFRAARTREVRLLLDLPIGHFGSAMRIAEEERRAFPEFADTFTFHAPPPRFERRFGEELELADVLVCGSRFVRDSFVSQGIPAEKLVVVKYGSSLPVITEDEAQMRRVRLAAPNPGPLRVVFVGQFSQRKGLSYLIETVRAAKRRSNIHFTMIGSFVGGQSWLEVNRDLVDNLVIRASRERLRAELLAADVFFFPSLFEGSALVVHEAAALGLPVVTTVNAGVDFVAETGIGEVHAIRDVERHTDTLVRFADDRAHLSLVTNQAIAHADTSSWNAFYRAVPTL